MNSPPVSDQLAPLQTGISLLPGVGGRAAPLLRKIAGGSRVIDLLLTLPERYVNRSRVLRLPDAVRTCAPGDVLTTSGCITRIESPSRRGRSFHIYMEDAEAVLDLVFFNNAFIRGFKVGEIIAVSGTVDRYHGCLVMPQPDYVLPGARRDHIPTIDPVWPLTAGLFQSTVRRAMASALTHLPILPEWLDERVLKSENWPGFRDALLQLQSPGTAINPAERADWLTILQRARKRLACDRLFYNQLAMGATRMRLRQQKDSGLGATGVLQAEALKTFGYELTGAQKRVMREIAEDMTRPSPMLRLVQGDVGSGKTIVALAAMLHAAEAGVQSALMAPTELLARQHFDTFSKLSPVPVLFLSGQVKGKARVKTLQAIEDGSARLVVGTHALFQDKVTFHKLGLCVIDEQHRFGVAQRLRLGSKAQNANTLVMTATPIPRSLLLTRWGELTVSRIDEKPRGRKPVLTSIHPLKNLANVYNAISRKIKDGSQVYWVCPLIEESEKLDLAAAEDRYKGLSEVFPGQVGLAHGKQDATQRQQTLDAFRDGTFRILTATTVIEVGVDVPQASVMVIEHAERFGLAQLHQLRGRVGRGQAQSYCLLLYEESKSFNAQKRLALLKQTEDGFLIAEEDYQMRGGGDIAGHRQTGMPDPRLLGGMELQSTLETAKILADAYWKGDGPIQRSGTDLQSLLAVLFGVDESLDFLASG